MDKIVNLNYNRAFRERFNANIRPVLEEGDLEVVLSLLSDFEDKGTVQLAMLIDSLKIEALEGNGICAFALMDAKKGWENDSNLYIDIESFFEKLDYYSEHFKLEDGECLLESIVKNSGNKAAVSLAEGVLLKQISANDFLSGLARSLRTGFAIVSSDESLSTQPTQTSNHL